ncbi:MAG TPA: ATP-dependent DNA helicase RecQ [Acidobacteriota bacterium]|nr:ATP-dependent DNA helicase RecQ [Acidobacteriota bacterium]
MKTIPEIAGLLAKHFGFSEFRPGQERVIDALLNRSAALAVFPTGGGKSLCYQLPALAFEGVTLVVSPLIALMKDQIDSLTGRGVAAARMDSSLSAEEAAAASKQLRSGTLKLLYVAPERFNNERFLAAMKRTRIALFAIDEAHCISEWGHNFRPDYLKLAAAARELKAERVLALTATATPTVVKDICAGFGIPPECAIITGFYRPNLTLWTTPVSSQERDVLLLDRIRNQEPGPTIVYVTLQKTAERVSEELERAGYPSRPYHAGMESDARTRVQEWWMASDRNIVVATIAFGMGIDKANVRYIYHYNAPKSLESYSQEIGRAGRDGAPSRVELLACPEDVPTLENFAYGDTPTEGSLGGLIDELFDLPPEFSISVYELSPRFDIRQLVLRTALTYLELLGYLRQGTPYYAGYKIKPLLPQAEIVAKFDGERARFVADVFSRAKEGRTWYSLDVESAADELGQDRSRIIRALEYLEEQNWVELQVSDVRQRYTRMREPDVRERLVEKLTLRFQRREQQEVHRVAQVYDLVQQAGCQTNALVGYFGEARTQSCGHCTYCLTGRSQQLPPTTTSAPLPAGIAVEDILSLRTSHREALGDPRQTARFLCGLNSPAITKAKLTRHELFGVFEDRRFAEVLAWCRQQSGEGH